MPPLAFVQVYPRPRGEYSYHLGVEVPARGLPPPTRGIHSRPKSRALHIRSTPAHAGNTYHVQHEPASGEVYPRPRGEYGSWRFAARVSNGLPPPTRGIRVQRAARCHHRGSTPAHAGNTAAAIWAAGLVRVYPRPRGEYALFHIGERGGIGLPPPTRGIPTRTECALLMRRSTPAHAGNTQGCAGHIASHEVYPRPRGEYASSLDAPAARAGLPPPTRGIRHNAESNCIYAGSTPAHAGNTC